MITLKEALKLSKEELSSLKEELKATNLPKQSDVFNTQRKLYTLATGTILAIKEVRAEKTYREVQDRSHYLRAR